MVNLGRKSLGHDGHGPALEASGQGSGLCSKLQLPPKAGRPKPRSTPGAEARGLSERTPECTPV